MKYISVDIEADGDPTPDYSMVSFGCVVVEPALDRTFFGEIRPISCQWVPEALAVSGYTREQTLQFEKPEIVIPRFSAWLNSIRKDKERLMFVSDNNGFDWQYINYYLRHFTGDNPFGYTSMNISSLYKGMVKDCFKNHKHLRDTRHSHNPVDDARGNAESLLKMESMGLILGKLN